MKPLTQSEIDATGLLDGWTVDDMYETLIDPTGFRFKGCVKTAITRLVRTCIANRLEAAPPVEQSEPAPEHPLHAGYVILDGEKRELRRSMRVNICPFCDTNFFNGEHNPDKCKAGYVPAPIYQFLAPPAVIEPEPECATCGDTGLIEKGHPRFEGPCPDGCAESRSLHPQFWKAVDQKREIISRKGDK